MRPPRELRTVAILLTLTDRRIKATPDYREANSQAADSRAGVGSCHLGSLRTFDVPFDGIDNFLTPFPDLGLVFAFQHHPQQRLRS